MVNCLAFLDSTVFRRDYSVSSPLFDGLHEQIKGGGIIALTADMVIAETVFGFHDDLREISSTAGRLFGRHMFDDFARAERYDRELTSRLSMIGIGIVSVAIPDLTESIAREKRKAMPFRSSLSWRDWLIWNAFLLACVNHKPSQAFFVTNNSKYYTPKDDSECDLSDDIVKRGISRSAVSVLDDLSKLLNTLPPVVPPSNSLELDVKERIESLGSQLLTLYEPMDTMRAAKLGTMPVPYLRTQVMGQVVKSVTLDGLDNISKGETHCNVRATVVILTTARFMVDARHADHKWIIDILGPPIFASTPEDPWLKYTKTYEMTYAVSAPFNRAKKEFAMLSGNLWNAKNA